MKKIIFIITIFISILFFRKVNAYTEYKIGDEVSYNNIDYYVIKNSGANEKEVTMLKAEALTVDEVNEYGAGHVNRYTFDSVGTAYNQNGYGGMAYYTSETCGYDNNYNLVDSGCTNDYESSEVKYVVDAWAQAKVPSGLRSSRLITIEDLEDNLGYEQDPSVATQKVPSPTNTPSWVYYNSYYWMESQYEDSEIYVWHIYGRDGYLSCVYNYNIVVRPVIILSKTVLGDVDENIIDVNNFDIDKGNKNVINSTTVKVDNTYMSMSIILIILGLIIASISIFVLYKISNKKVK